MNAFGAGRSESAPARYALGESAGLARAFAELDAAITAACERLLWVSDDAALDQVTESAVTQLVSERSASQLHMLSRLMTEVSRYLRDADPCAAEVGSDASGTS